jgi:hypothetical protein
MWWQRALQPEIWQNSSYTAALEFTVALLVILPILAVIFVRGFRRGKIIGLSLTENPRAFHSAQLGCLIFIVLLGAFTFIFLMLPSCL